jgi:hypothetical protein
MKFCNGTTRQQSFGVTWGTCPPDSLEFFAFLLLQSALGSLPSVALSSAGASGIGP